MKWLYSACSNGRSASMFFDHDKLMYVCIFGHVAWDAGIIDDEKFRHADKIWLQPEEVTPNAQTVTEVLLAQYILKHEDPIVKSVCDDLMKRSEIGMKKYGTTLERTDLSLVDWLQHAYEEILDQANYLKRAIIHLKEGK